MDRRQRIFVTVSDLVADLMYYDRKEDDQLPRGAIEEAIESGEITVDEIANHFRQLLT